MDDYWKQFHTILLQKSITKLAESMIEDIQVSIEKVFFKEVMFEGTF